MSLHKFGSFRIPIIILQFAFGCSHKSLMIYMKAKANGRKQLVGLISVLIQHLNFDWFEMIFEISYQLIKVLNPFIFKALALMIVLSLMS